jgi:post-segregation antitoxin (ccd killing protein)
VAEPVVAAPVAAEPVVAAPAWDMDMRKAELVALAEGKGLDVSGLTKRQIIAELDKTVSE